MKFYNYFIYIIAAFLISCSNNQKAFDDKVYFNIKSFFESEAKRLQVQKKAIRKTVEQNHQSETKQVTITDWQNELNLFIESDINKPSWKDSYTVNQNGSTLTYLAKEEKLKTRKIVIQKSADGKVRSILIRNKVKNYLYSSEEELTYHTDSSYQITKKQSVIFIGDNTFKVEGFFFKKNLNLQ